MSWNRETGGQTDGREIAAGSCLMANSRPAVYIYTSYIRIHAYKILDVAGAMADAFRHAI
jgi:hypothetical protein